MINPKYYNDIKAFPTQFEKGFELTSSLKLDGDFSRVCVFGMGGSSLYVELVNNYLATFSNFRVSVNRGYDLTTSDDEKTLFVLASYSGNTEEVLSVLDQVKKKNFKYVVFSAGGKLLEDAKATGAGFFEIPAGLQPRLSTGYFIAGLLQLLMNQKFIKDVKSEVLTAAGKIDSSLDEELAKELGKKLVNKVPILYSTSENDSIARISKIKFNENAKTQAFWNVFPELNHNEMVGFSSLVMSPLFIIFKSQFTHERNHRRIETFVRIMNDKKVETLVKEMKGSNVLEEILSEYYFIDHVTFYLAEGYGIDPEPVDMVEEFKKLIG